MQNPSTIQGPRLRPLPDTQAPLTPTYRGYIESTQDALLLFEGCMQGLTPHVPRRPHDRERHECIKSGYVYVYEEHSSGIKRWTDGVSWSPSRILGNFLVYRELDRPFPPGEKKRAAKKKPKSSHNGVTKSDSSGRTLHNGMQDNHRADRSLIGSLVDSYPFKENGLIKKTISVTHNNISHHLVSYYDVEEVQAGGLSVPSRDPKVMHIQVRPSISNGSNFRTGSAYSQSEGEMNASHYGIYQPPQPLPTSYPVNHIQRTLSLPESSLSYPPYGIPAFPGSSSMPWQTQAPSFIGTMGPAVPTLPSASTMGYEDNYNLHAIRPPRVMDEMTIQSEYPRTAFPNSPQRRHSTFETTGSSNVGSYSLGSIPEGHHMPSTDSSLYFMPPGQSTSLEDQSEFAPAHHMKTEPDLGENVDAQEYPLHEDNSQNWHGHYDYKDPNGRFFQGPNGNSNHWTG